MVARDCRPGSPPDGTVRADRRSCDSLRAAPSWPAEEALRCRTGVPGRDAGAAGRPQRASLAADVLRPARAPVPVPAAPARYHKRVTAAAPLLAAVLDYLARECPSWYGQVR